MEAKTKKTKIAKSGKYLTFALEKEEYGLEIMNVREIIGIMDITSIPKAENYVKGVINLRGKVIPVIDLRLKFGMSATEYTKETCIIVLNLKNNLMGIIIDKVCEVLDITEEDIEAAPSFGKVEDFMIGMAKIGGKVKILLDIESVLEEEVVSLV